VIRKRQRSATYMQLQSKNFLTPFLHYTWHGSNWPQLRLLLMA
jgi:hypothetical protein